jgi:hypothetical protein
MRREAFFEDEASSCSLVGGDNMRSKGAQHSFIIISANKCEFHQQLLNITCRAEGREHFDVVFVDL